MQECKLRGSQNAGMQIRRNAPYTKSELQKVQNGKSAKSANWQIARVQECRLRECRLMNLQGCRTVMKLWNTETHEFARLNTNKFAEFQNLT